MILPKPGQAKVSKRPDLGKGTGKAAHMWAAFRDGTAKDAWTRLSACPSWAMHIAPGAGSVGPASLVEGRRSSRQAARGEEPRAAGSRWGAG